MVQSNPRSDGKEISKERVAVSGKIDFTQFLSRFSGPPSLTIKFKKLNLSTLIVAQQPDVGLGEM